MVRGCQKKIIYLKNSGSDIFEEAYFVIKSDIRYEETSECDMIEEANRIIEESFCTEEKEKLAGRVLSFVKKIAIPFFVGVVIGVTVTLLFKN